MRLFFRAPAFFVLRAQKVGLRRRETEARGGRTSAYAHRHAAVCAGGAGKRCAPERDFSQPKPATGFVSARKSIAKKGNLLQKYGGVTAQALVDSALGHVRLLNDCGFDDICISVKCSHVPVNMEAYRMLHEQTHYPLHLGVTEAGTPRLGVLKSAIGIGGLLCQGIGDTLRVSLTADPEEEVRAALDILSAAGLRKTGPDLISCPTCGRTRYDMIPIAREVERRLQGCTKPITVAVMGCVVNGPGEARAADVGIAGGDGEGLLFRHGEILRKVPQDKLVDALMDEIDKL